MEGLLFIIILVVFNLLRSAGRQKQQQQRKAPPPPRPPRTFLDVEPEPELESEPRPRLDRDEPPQPEARPGTGRRRIFLEDFRFPRKEEVKAPAFREEPAAIEKQEIGVKRMTPSPAPTAAPDKRLELFKAKSDLARGIILAEVLGPPLSKRKKRGFV